ncbi:hypothetical protein GQR58_006037 [Nymphon striatum]|nr:hypothetical protein GQR58_006037 [Nymphon striatum]
MTDLIFEAYRKPSHQVGAGNNLPIFIGGGSGIPVFQGGSGILSNIWRFTRPILTKLVKPASRVALGVASDVLTKNQSPTTSLKRRALHELNEIIIPKKMKKTSKLMKMLKSELALFDNIETQTIQEKSLIVDVHPVSQPTGYSPLEFFVSGDGEYYIDINDTLITLAVKIIKSDPSNEDTFASNLLLSSLFANCEVFLNNTQVEGGTHLYPYKAYFSTLLQYSKDAKTTHLRSYGYFKDEPDKFESIDGFGNKMRKEAAKNTMHLSGPIFADIFQQPRYILPHVGLRLRFTRQSKEFSLLNFGNKTTGNILIEDAVLYVKKVKVTPSVSLAHADGLKFNNAIYPLQRQEIITYTISNGNTSHVKDNLFHGRIPKYLAISLVENSAFGGNVTKNPLIFNILTLNMLRTNASCDITMKDYKNGSTIFGFNLSPDEVITGHAQTRRYGQLKLQLQFLKPLVNTINVIVFAIFDDIIHYMKHVAPPRARRIFQGVYPSSNIQPPTSYPASYIINLDDDSLPGSHWIALYLEKRRKGEVFDSLARYPNYRIASFMNKHTNGNWTVNNLTYQHHFSLAFKYAHHMFDITPKKFVWMSMSPPPDPILFHVDNMNYEPRPYDMIICDDMLLASSNNKDITELFTRKAHHKPCFIVFISLKIFFIMAKKTEQGV